MFDGLFVCLVLSGAVASISCTISKAGVMRPIRQWVREKNAWLGKLISCVYCTSHWISAVFVVIYRPTPLRLIQPIDSIVAVFLTVTRAAGMIYWIEWSIGFQPDPPVKEVENS
jgi:hypothetical protein